MEQVSTLEVPGKNQGKGSRWAPGGRAQSSLLHLYWWLCRLLPFQLTLAPRFLPSTLISVDFAANYLTKIYGLTFGQKPNLRSEG